MTAPDAPRRSPGLLLAPCGDALALLGALLLAVGHLPSPVAGSAAAPWTGGPAIGSRAEVPADPAVLPSQQLLPAPTAVARVPGQDFSPQPGAIRSWGVVASPDFGCWLLGQRKHRFTPFSAPESGLVAHKPQGPPGRAG